MDAMDFKDTWMPLAGRFYRVAYYILESRDDAEDAVQDLVLKLWKMRATIGEVRNPVSFGITVLRNVCLDRIRAASSSKVVNPAPETMDVLLDPAESTDVGLIRKEDMEKIRACMARLPDRQRKVLEMRVFENLPFEEIARRTGLSEANVRVKLSNARKNLKKLTES